MGGQLKRAGVSGSLGKASPAGISIFLFTTLGIGGSDIQFLGF